MRSQHLSSYRHSQTVPLSSLWLLNCVPSRPQLLRLHSIRRFLCASSPRLRASSDCQMRVSASLACILKHGSTPSLSVIHHIASSLPHLFSHEPLLEALLRNRRPLVLLCTSLIRRARRVGNRLRHFSRPCQAAHMRSCALQTFRTSIQRLAPAAPASAPREVPAPAPPGLEYGLDERRGLSRSVRGRSGSNPQLI